MPRELTTDEHARPALAASHATGLSIHTKGAES